MLSLPPESRIENPRQRPQSPQAVRGPFRPGHPAEWTMMAGLALLGVFLRAKDYLSGRSLWVDEVKLALNVVERGFSDLARPLDENQAAPVGFLWLTKILTLAFGHGEPVLRLIPFVTSLVSLPLAYFLVRRIVGVRGALISLGILAVSPSVVQYATDAKQYASDLFVSLCLCGTAWAFLEAPRPSTWVGLALLGVLAPLFSHGVVFMIGGLGMMLLLHEMARRRWRNVAGLGVVGGLVCASIGMQYLLLWSGTMGKAGLVGFHSERFLPFPPRTLEDLGVWAERPVEVFQRPMGIEAAKVGVAIFALGIVDLLRRRRWELAGFYGLPLLLAVIAACLRLYPFNDRFLQFAVPCFLLGIVVGFESLFTASNRWVRRVGWASLLFVAIVSLKEDVKEGLFWPPRTKEEMRPVVAQVAGLFQGSDAVYVYKNAVSSYQFYTRWDAAGQRLAGSETIWGYAMDPHFFEQEIQPFLGRPRVWVIFSHVRESRMSGLGQDVEFLRLLDRRGRRLAAFEDDGAAAYLYDLTPAQAEAPPAGAG